MSFNEQDKYAIKNLYKLNNVFKIPVIRKNILIYKKFSKKSLLLKNFI